MRYEDYTREERVELMLTDLDAYMALLGKDQYDALLDPLMSLEPYEPGGR